MHSGWAGPRGEKWVEEEEDGVRAHLVVSVGGRGRKIRGEGEGEKCALEEKRKQIRGNVDKCAAAKRRIQFPQRKNISGRKGRDD